MKNKKLGLFSSMSVCIGLIVSTSCLLSLSRGFGASGVNFIVAMALTVIINALLSVSFNELRDIMPNVGGGLAQYTLAGLGPLASFVSTGASYIITNILAPAVELAMCAMVLKQILFPQIPEIVLGLAILLFVLAVNLFGIGSFEKTQNAVVVILIGSFIVLGVISILKLGGGAVTEKADWFYEISAEKIVSAVPVAFWLFVGIESVIPIAGHMKNPKRDVILAMLFGTSLLFVVQTVLGLGICNYVGAGELCASDVPHMLFAENLLGRSGVYWMGIIAVCAGISTVNAGIGNAARIMAGMSECGILPGVFGRKNKRGAADVSLYMLSAGCGLVLITGFAASAKLTSVILAASCFWLFSYMLANISVLNLRRRYPELAERNKKLVLKGIPQYISIAAEAYMILSIVLSEENAGVLGVFFGMTCLLTVLGVIWIKGVKKQSLFACPSLQFLTENK